MKHCSMYWTLTTLAAIPLILCAPSIARAQAAQSANAPLSFVDQAGVSHTLQAASGVSLKQPALSLLSSLHNIIPYPGPIQASNDATRLLLSAPTSRDADGDGLSDKFENQLADAFTPYYHVSANERSGTGFATFQDRADQLAVLQNLAPTPPLSYFRVTPLGTTTDTNGVPVGVIRLDYLTLWNRDDGVNLADCSGWLGWLLGLVGIDTTSIYLPLLPHELDEEHSTTLVAAPLLNGTFDKSAADYSAYGFYTAAHESLTTYSPVEQSRYFIPQSPVPAGNHIELWLSRAKHSTYTFNPEGWPIIRSEIMYLTYETLDFLYWEGVYDWYWYAVFEAAADWVFFDCIIEHFDEQGGMFAQPRINVGELNRPLNNANFILSPQLRPKFDYPFWR